MGPIPQEPSFGYDSSIGQSLKRRVRSRGLSVRRPKPGSDYAEEDISMFKRIVQEVSDGLNIWQQPHASSTTLEVAASILGVFPLIISAAEHYKEGFEPLVKWKRFRTDFIGFIDTIDIEKQLFDQMLELFLISADIEQHQLQLFMTSPNHDGWQSKDLTANLRNRLGPSYETFSKNVMTMSDIMGELQSLLSLQDGEVIGLSPFRLRFSNHWIE